MANTDMQKQEVLTSEMERTRHGQVFIPRTDIYERGDALVVVADMPGVDETSVDINVENRVLTIRGRVEPGKFPEHRPAIQEYEMGDFERSFTLSEEVDIEKIEASVKQGVLRIVLPKAESARPRKIQVKAG